MIHDRRRGGVLGGLLITFVGIAAIAAICGVYILRNVRVRETAHDNLSIDLPGGRIQIRGHEHVDAASLGVPVYPQARWTKESGGASFEWASDDDSDSREFSVAGGEYTTTDSTEKVVEYYKAQLPSWIIVRRGGNTEFKLKEGGYQRIIGIKEKNGETHIGVAAIGKPAAN